MINEFLLNVLLPVAVFVVMLISGTGVQASDIRSARVFGRSVSICLGTQLVVGPAAVLLLIGGSGPVTFVGLGLLVLSICPSGTLSTGYTYIAGGNVALSAILSTSSTLVYAIAFPLLAAMASGILGAVSLEDSLPVGKMVIELLEYVVLPVILGAIIRHRFPGHVERHRRLLLTLAGGMTVAVVITSAIAGWQSLVGSFLDVFTLSVVFTLLSLGAGHLAAGYVAPQDRSALTIECAVRNIPVAMVIARDIHAQGTLTGFFVGFFIANALVLGAYCMAQRWRLDVGSGTQR